MEQNERVERVREMEEAFEKLKAYMESGQWKEDFEADEAGELPRGLKRGVLSEDGLYDLLEAVPAAGSIDRVLAYNRKFVAAEGYRPFLTDKFPAKKLAVVSCMDTRLSVLLQEALGLRNGDAKIIKNAGALVPGPWDSAMRSLLVAVYELGVNEIMIVAHTTCGACHMSFAHFREEMLKRGIPAAALRRDDIDLDAWLEGFHDTEQSVRDTVTAVRRHPLMPGDVSVRGFIIDSATGALSEVPC